jgi:hypothetical protein
VVTTLNGTLGQVNLQKTHEAVDALGALFQLRLKTCQYELRSLEKAGTAGVGTLYAVD